MKKVIVNGLCATLVCFFLSSFSANSNSLGNTNPEYSNAPTQDTAKKMKKKVKMDKKTGDTTKMKMKKKPS